MKDKRLTHKLYKHRRKVYKNIISKVKVRIVERLKVKLKNRLEIKRSGLVVNFQSIYFIDQRFVKDQRSKTNHICRVIDPCKGPEARC